MADAHELPHKRSDQADAALSFSPRQLQRLHALQLVLDGYITLKEAAQKMDISYRQAKRLKQSFANNGSRGIQHGNTGRTSPKALAGHIRTRVVYLAGTRYAALNDSQLTKRLQDDYGICLSRETVRKILRSEGIKRSTVGRSGFCTQRKNAYPHEGMMVLWGGITRRWFGEHESCFMAAVDTATLRCLAARFFPEQSSRAYLWLLREVVRTAGIPAGFCQHSRSAVRRSDACWTIEEELRGERDPSQVERALTALGIRQYLETKSKIMSITVLFETFVTRQLDARDIAALDGANKLLDRGLIAAFNRTYACEPEQPEPAWRKLPEGFDLERICSVYYPAAVQHDNTVVLGDIRIDVPPGRNRISYAKAPVEARQLLDGSWRIYYGNDCIAGHGPTPLREPVTGKSSKPRSEPVHSSWASELLAYAGACD